MLLPRNNIRAVSLDHHVTAEPQHFAHQSMVLTSVDDDQSANALLDGLDGEPKLAILQCQSPIQAQRGLATNNAGRLR